MGDGLALGSAFRRWGGACALAAALGPAAAQDGPVYRLTYLPDEADNLICFSAADARDLLVAFRARFLAEERPRARRLLRTFEDQIGPGARYDCAFVRSIYVPRQPVVAIDIAEELALDWGEHDEHYFVAAELLVGDTRYTQTTSGDPIYVFTSDFVILKE